jgi:hypothetical protein
MTGIALELAQPRAAVNTPVASRVSARDALGLRSPLPEDAALAYMVLDRSAGFWQDGYYTPLTEGLHTVHVWYNHMWATQTLYVTEIAELRAGPLSMTNGEQRRLYFTGTGADGIALHDVNVTGCTVVPETLGRVENGYFHAESEGTGYIRAWVGNVITYIPVSIGKAAEDADANPGEIPPLPEVPQGTRFRDPMQTHGEFTGIPGGGHYTFDVTFRTAVYRFRHDGDMAIFRLLADGAGLTERGQWEYIPRDVRAADAYHVVIMLNVNPFDFPPLVFELFHSMMKTLADEGRTVFVVSSPSAASVENTAVIRDGVRYIYDVEEIRFFTDGELIWWYA